MDAGAPFLLDTAAIISEWCDPKPPRLACPLSGRPPVEEGLKIAHTLAAGVGATSTIGSCAAACYLRQCQNLCSCDCCCLSGTAAHPQLICCGSNGPEPLAPTDPEPRHVVHSGKVLLESCSVGVTSSRVLRVFGLSCSNDRQRVFRCIAVEACRRRRHPHVILPASPRSLPVFPLGDVDRDPPAPLRVMYCLLLLVLFRVLQHRGLSHCTAEKGYPPPSRQVYAPFPWSNHAQTSFRRSVRLRRLYTASAAPRNSDRHVQNRGGIFEWS